MTSPAPRKLFVNLPVRDLPRSITFFTKLGFTFDPRFTDASATCMIVNGEAYIMLLTETRFRDFTKRELADTTKTTEALIAFSLGSRAEVDAIVKLAIESGGSPAMPVSDLGFMYGWSFYDPDGHHWEVFYMDMAALPPEMQG